MTKLLRESLILEVCHQLETAVCSAEKIQVGVPKAPEETTLRARTEMWWDDDSAVSQIAIPE